MWGLGIGDWGLGIGDSGLEIGPNTQSPIHNSNKIKAEIKNINFKKLDLIIFY
jgi:hypothetical protein